MNFQPKPQYHILNGDVLQEQLLEDISGSIIVARECLVDGDVSGDDIEALYKTRAAFIAENYSGYTVQDYYDHVVPEFQQILNIPNESDVNVWFEDDLFCQVNLWFVLHLLSKSLHEPRVFLIRPKVQTRYGFGGLSTSELLSLYENRVELDQLNLLSELWALYQAQDMDRLLEIGLELDPQYPFILSAIRAHIKRLPNENSLGRPKEILLEIMAELETEAFAPIFKAFCERVPIYGFGDTYVQRLLQELSSGDGSNKDILH